MPLQPKSDMYIEIHSKIKNKKVRGTPKRVAHNYCCVAAQCGKINY